MIDGHSVWDFTMNHLPEYPVCFVLLAGNLDMNCSVSGMINMK